MSTPQPLSHNPCTPRSEYPVVIIGAGPAGSAAAAALVREGRRVALFDRDTFPRDKLCGEFLSGESNRLLHDLGCLDSILETSPPEIDQMDFTAPGGGRVSIRLPSPALGVSRRTLDLALLNHARRLGAEVFESADVQNVTITPAGVELEIAQAFPGSPTIKSTVRAALVIAAYGRSSKLDRALQRPAASFGQKTYVGFKRHHLTRDGGIHRELNRRGEMHLFPDGYCGIAPVDGSFINVCLMIHSQSVRKLAPTGHWEDIAARISDSSPALAARLAGLLPCPDRPMLAVAPVTFSPREKASGSVLFAGDAAGMIAPLCGDGQAMALESGLRLAQLILSVPETDLPARAPELGRHWSGLWETEFRRRMTLGRWLQHLVLSPRLAGPTVRLLAAFPPAATALARATRGR